jgi:hypothetical protein
MALEEASSSTPPSSKVPDFLGASSTLYLHILIMYVSTQVNAIKIQKREPPKMFKI